MSGCEWINRSSVACGRSPATAPTSPLTVKCSRAVGQQPEMLSRRQWNDVTMVEWGGGCQRVGDHESKRPSYDGVYGRARCRWERRPWTWWAQQCAAKGGWWVHPRCGQTAEVRSDYRGGFNGRSLVQWPTRPLRGWALEAPGPRGPGRLNFGLQLQSPDWNLNWIYDLFKLETSTLIRRSVLSEF